MSFFSFCIHNLCSIEQGTKKSWSSCLSFFLLPHNLPWWQRRPLWVTWYHLQWCLTRKWLWADLLSEQICDNYVYFLWQKTEVFLFNFFFQMNYHIHSNTVKAFISNDINFHGFTFLELHWDLKVTIFNIMPIKAILKNYSLCFYFHSFEVHVQGSHGSLKTLKVLEF